METQEDLEAKAAAEFHAHLGKILRVTGWIFGFEDEDSQDWKVDLQTFPAGVRVRVMPTPQDELARWNDDWLDPVWNVELIDVQDNMKEGRSFTIHGTSFNEDGRIEKSAWSISNE